MMADKLLFFMVAVLVQYCVCGTQDLPSIATQRSTRPNSVTVYVLGNHHDDHCTSMVQVYLNPEGITGSKNWTVHQHFEDCKGVIVSTIEADLSVTVRADYELFPGVGYYKFHSEAKTWTQGKKICEDEGTHLVIINSEEELAVVNLMYRRNKDNIKGANNKAVVGVGFQDQNIEGHYVTIFGDPLLSTGFERWSQVPNPQPDNDHGNENCGSILAATDGLFNDIGCDNANIAFVCEQEVARPARITTNCLNLNH